ncbi:DNA-binding protein [Salmonella enterica]|nr:DNA-binding protein [Salmonella enterica]EEM9676003.1 DNA-binding protein [Salmonella enterica]EEN5961673.1 DNA-binding protein [Salmonella enterica]EHP4289183.1 DNA-binding protein [Salmonella enterica]EJA5029929.1 DNA-binding protein [Salmonella enterica]
MTVEKDESKTRLTPAEWAEAEAKWTSGEYTLSKLEEEYGIRRETLSRHFKKRGLEKGADSVGKMVRESLKSDAELRAKARADKIEERRTRYDDWAFALGRMVMHEVATAKKESKPLAAIEDDLKSLQRASGTLAKCFDISSKALGMDRAENDDEEIPNLVFGELTPSQVAQLRKDDEPEPIDDDLLESLEEEALSEAGSDSAASEDEDDGSV